MMAERVASRRPREMEPIDLGSKCRPFLKVEKDPAKFAACNALANEIGPLDTPKKAFRFIGDAIVVEVNEIFGVVTVDVHLRVKGFWETGHGDQSSVMAPMVPTLQAALIDGAHAVIIFHVHPSGVVAEPSEADKDTTKAFVDAFEVVNVHFLDHIIVGGDAKKRSYYSFLEDKAI
jgi:DNA repair protein RadC